jgi:hypothetical protein
MPAPCRISAKNLGALALPTFCPRCLWLKLRLKNRLPWQTFPGIFSSIDVFSKQVTDRWFAETGGSPPWLKPFGNLVESIDPPHWSQFSVVDEASGVELRGVPDHLFRAKDGSTVIIDNKTARFTAGQDALLPLYAVQLHAYAWIAERKGFARAVELFLDSAKLIPPLLREFRRLYDLRVPPDGRRGCKDCAAANALLSLSRAVPVSQRR